MSSQRGRLFGSPGTHPRMQQWGENASAQSEWKHNILAISEERCDTVVLASTVPTVVFSWWRITNPKSTSSGFAFCKKLKSCSFLFFKHSHKNIPRQKSCIKEDLCLLTHLKAALLAPTWADKPCLVHKDTRAVHCSAAQLSAVLAAWAWSSQAVREFNFLHKCLYVWGHVFRGIPLLKRNLTF